MNPAIAATLVWLGLSIPGPVSPVQTGSVTITGDPAQCTAAFSVQVWAISYNKPAAQLPQTLHESFVLRTDLSSNGGFLSAIVSFVDGKKVDGSCAWAFEDLATGEYVALLTRPDGSGGSERFTIAAGDQAAVTIPPPLVQLSGRFVRNGEPVPGLQISVMGYPFARPSVSASADGNGHFTLWLDRPGLHEVTVRSQNASFDLALEEGPNSAVMDLARTGH